MHSGTHTRLLTCTVQPTDRKYHLNLNKWGQKMMQAVSFQQL